MKFSLLSFLTLSLLFTPLVHAASLAGVWRVEGHHQEKGAYQGQLELRPTADGTFQAVRIVTYSQYRFQNFRVQEVWTGTARPTSTGVLIKYTLKHGDYITRVGSENRATVDFKTRIEMFENFVAVDAGFSALFLDFNKMQSEENISAPTALPEKPLWQDERRLMSAQGPDIPWIVRGVIEALKLKIGYADDPVVKASSQHPEYQNENPYFIFDPTDYGFYQTHSDVLRVTNKITDTISLTETLVRRNAYAPSLDEKARGFDRNMEERHLNAYGLYVSVIVDENDRVLRDEEEGDGTLWTGMYMGSQAMRYQLTKDPQALANVRRALRGFFLLLDLPQDPKDFARTVRAHDPAREMSGRWQRGTGKFASLDWMSGANNDMVKGILHGFYWASQVIPESDTEIWNELKEKSRRLPKLKVLEKKKQNIPAALGLVALISKDARAREKYLESYDNFRSRLDDYFNTDFYWHGSADWSGINLSTVGALTNIWIADSLGATDIRDRLRAQLLDTWVAYKPIRRPLQIIATYAASFRQGTRTDTFNEESNTSEFNDKVQGALWALREIPYPRPTELDVSVDHSLSPEWSMSPLPRMFWKAFSNPMPEVSYFYQGLYSYPVFELDAFDSTFIWKESAFSYSADHHAGAERGSIDYLYAYWLSRSCGLLP